MSKHQESTVFIVSPEGLEQAVVAYNAVQTVHGDEHPLLQPTNETYGRGYSLWDTLYAKDGEPSLPFVGDEAELIFKALEVIASGKTESVHAVMANIMVDEIEAHNAQAEPGSHKRVFVPQKVLSFIPR